MNQEKHAVRLLLVESSQNEAARLTSLFRNAGHATRMHRVDEAGAFSEALKNPWDLCLATSCETLPPELVLQLVKQSKADLSVIQLQDNDSLELRHQAMQQGAQDALPAQEDALLLLIARRELASLRARRTQFEVEQALREAEKRCQLLLDSSRAAIAYVHEGMHVYVNQSYQKLFGYQDPDDLAAMPLIDLIAPEDQAGFRDFMRNYSRDPSSADYQCLAIGADGKPFTAQISCSPAAFDGEPCVQLLIRTSQNNTELEQQLRTISSQDLVTGLLNRQHFLELLQNSAEAVLTSGQSASLAYIRIDQYSRLASELGMACIDQLLTDFALQLRQSLHPDSQLARLGDNQFCALLSNATPEQHKNELESLRAAIEQRLFEVSGRTVQITLSIGVAGLNTDNSDAAEVLDRARRCSEQQTKGNQLQLYDSARELAASASLGNQIALVQHALDTNSFRLLFQPVIGLRGEKSELYEVLLRLINPQGEELAPKDFMHAAIDSGLAAKLDRWVVLNSIRLLAQHQAKGQPASLFVHLSNCSLQDPEFLTWLSAALQSVQLPAGALIFQIREQDAITYLVQAKQVIDGLHALQCQVALGQFGRAEHPFNTLEHLEVDYVKIDGSFTTALNETGNQDSLKEMLTRLHAQSKQSIVPFVESASILSVLWQAGVSYIQGHYLQAPGASMDYDFGSDD